jgi:GT2 family glycosyltransferase
MSHSFLKAIGRSTLRPFPKLSAQLYRLATAPGTVTAKPQSLITVAAKPQTLIEFRDPSSLVDVLYNAAFGRDADEVGRVHWVQQLQSGAPLEVLAEMLVRSPEFQSRHGNVDNVDIKYISVVYRDGLGRPADLGSLSYWLVGAQKGATRAQVLAELAGSEEAMERIHPPEPNSGASYSRWIAMYDSISDADRVAIRTHIAGLPFRPLISIIMPVGSESKAAFWKSFNSIINQLYPYWELSIVIDALTEPVLVANLRIRTTSESRIRIVRTETAEDIAAAGNTGFASTTGEFVTFLQAGDMFSEHALYEIAIELGANAQPDIVYSDSDQIDSDGQRINPWFKPGWDPDLLLARDYISNVAIYRRTLAEKVGFLRPGFEGAELYDLALRATAATTPDRISHVHAVLYHRQIKNEAVCSENASSDLRATAASQRAVHGHLDSLGHKDALLKPVPSVPGAIRVLWPVPEYLPLVSVIVLTRDRADLLAQCADGILHRTDYPNLELVIVDNGSIEPATDALFDRLTREGNRVRILRQPGPFNYSALNNAAARQSKGEILLLLNNDIDVIESRWLRELVSHAIRPDVGIVGAKLLHTNKKVQHAGVMLGPPGHAAHLYRFASRNNPGRFGQPALTRTLSAVTGACAAIRRAVFFEVGGLDEVDLPRTFNDVDLCLRLGDYGYRVVWTPYAELFHLESVSRGLEDTPATQKRFLAEWHYLRKTWGSLLESEDPFHNPNLLFHPDYYEMPTSPRRPRPWHYVVDQVADLNRHFPLVNFTEPNT